MTPRELQEQRISFTYGNLSYEDRRVTRKEVVRSSLSLGDDHGAQEGLS
jgi:hypothetical protein